MRTAPWRVRLRFVCSVAHTDRTADDFCSNFGLSFAPAFTRDPATTRGGAAPIAPERGRKSLWNGCNRAGISALTKLLLHSEQTRTSILRLSGLHEHTRSGGTAFLCGDAPPRGMGMESLWMLLAAWAAIGLVAVLGFARVLRRTALREERAGLTSLTGSPRR